MNGHQAGFNLFWEAYPKKRSKGQAEKVWAALTPDDVLLGVMLGKLDQAKQTSDWTKDGGKFIPHPATWLNAKGWEDELHIAAAQSTICEHCVPPQQLHEPRKSHEFKYHPKYEG